MEERKESALGCRAEKAQGGQTRRQKQRPRQSQQLPDHMIADRCQGQRRKVACRSGRAQDKVRMSKENERKERTERTKRGYSMEEKHGNIQETKDESRKKKRKRKT